MKLDARKHWQLGYGPIKHADETVQRIDALLASRAGDARLTDSNTAWALLAAADRISCVAMNVVAHMTYARRFDPSGTALGADDFKPAPEGHTGGALNMVPAFVGYLLANALTATTRGWIMGQGHSVAAIEAINALTGDVSLAQRGRYDRSEAGLSQLCRLLFLRDRCAGKARCAVGKPRRRTYCGCRLRGRLSWFRRASVHPHAVAGRVAGGVPERRRI